LALRYSISEKPGKAAKNASAVRTAAAAPEAAALAAADAVKINKRIGSLRRAGLLLDRAGTIWYNPTEKGVVNAQSVVRSTY